MDRLRHTTRLCALVHAPARNLHTLTRSHHQTQCPRSNQFPVILTDSKTAPQRKNWFRKFLPNSRGTLGKKRKLVIFSKSVNRPSEKNDRYSFLAGIVFQCLYRVSCVRIVGQTRNAVFLAPWACACRTSCGLARLIPKFPQDSCVRVRADHWPVSHFWHPSFRYSW